LVFILASLCSIISSVGLSFTQITASKMW